VPQHLRQEARFHLQPLADDTGALHAIGQPGLREYVIRDVAAFDAEGVLDDLDGENPSCALVAGSQVGT